MVEKDTLVVIAPSREELPDGIMAYYGSKKKKTKTEAKDTEQEKDI
jgi:hypothetical protein